MRSNSSSIRVAKLVEPLPGLGGDADGVAAADQDAAALLVVEQVDLVEDEEARPVAGVHLLEDGVHGGDRAGALLVVLRASTTWMIRSARRVSSSVALNASTS